MNRRRYKSPISKTAKEVVDKSYPDGAKEESSYFIGRTKVGRRFWWDDGQTVCAEYGMKDGKKHGNELRFHSDGTLLSVETYRNGIMHGKTKQFSGNGTLLIEYVLQNGVGLDLWCNDDGSLSEELYWPDEGELGFKRWWNEDNKSIFLEESWLDGFGSHGIFREWNNRGKMCRRFPQFYVKGQRLTKRQYLSACVFDQLLPPFVPEQDQPYRTLPQDYVAQRKIRKIR